MSQKQKIKTILREQGKISNFFAVETKLTYRLAARIAEIRKEGWDIETKEEDTNCIYTLIREPLPEQKKLL